MHGEGVFTWPDGRRYEGEYRNDLKDGYGTFKWRDGREYSGRWFHGRQHGEGIFKDGDRIVKGTWKNGETVSIDGKDVKEVRMIMNTIERD